MSAFFGSRAMLAPAFLALALLSPASLFGLQEKEKGAPAAAAEAEAHAPTGEWPLVPPTIWAIASFLVVLAILLKKLFPPIIQAMDKRAEEIRKALQAAEEARAEAEAMMARHEAGLEKARKEAAAIIEEGKADALKVAESIKVAARRDAEEIAGRARREIEQAKLVALKELQETAVRLSFDLASGLIKKNLSPDDHQDLIQERIRKLSRV